MLVCVFVACWWFWFLMFGCFEVGFRVLGTGGMVAICLLGSLLVCGFSGGSCGLILLRWFFACGC